MTTTVATKAYLDIANEIVDDLGLPRLSSMSSTAGPARQLGSLINREGRQQVRSFPWSVLQFLTTITTVADQAVYPTPGDFDRYLPSTQWDRANMWRVIGPDLPQTDRLRRESIVGGVGLHRVFRQVGYQVSDGRVGSTISIFPTPPADGDVLAYEYVSKCWAVDSGGTAQAALTADTDLPLLDPEILILGGKWRYLAAKGLSAVAARSEYDDYLATAKAQDNGMAPLSLNGPDGDDSQFIGLENVADGSWPE